MQTDGGDVRGGERIDLGIHQGVFAMVVQKPEVGQPPRGKVGTVLHFTMDSVPIISAVIKGKNDFQNLPVPYRRIARMSRGTAIFLFF
jgi:hypothetical protein